MSKLALKLIAENKAKHARGEDARVLDLGDCGLTEVPNISNLQWLQTLILSNEWFDRDERTWKYSINEGKSNQISLIPENSLPQGLNTLILSGEEEEPGSWRITSWKFLKNLHKLEKLDLSINKIGKANFLKNLTSLKHLYLNSNKINDLSFLENLTNLETLYCNNNKIININAIENLTALTTLELKSNQIVDISFLDTLNNLRVLNLRYNQIIDASAIGYLRNLEILDIRNNKINEIYFNKNIKLTTLDLSSNQIADLDSIDSLINLTVLNLRSNKITDASPIKHLTNLTSLDLTGSGNRIADLDFLESLTKLANLSIASDQITDATSIGNLSGLKVLYLRSREIKNISFVESLRNLTNLSLDTPKVKKWDYLKRLVSLKSLNLSTFRESEKTDLSIIENLTGLTELILPKKQIANIDFISKLTNLKKLDLRSNQISDITPLLPLIRQNIQVVMGDSISTGINLFGNPIVNPPIEILSKGNATILNYYGEQDKPQFINTQIKLILIGNATAGKTSLSKYLREQYFNADQPTTHGIQKYNWQPHSQREIKIDIWDFGGQEYYHATHRLFLSRNTVYVLVWDGKTDKGGTVSTEIRYENDSKVYSLPLEHFSKIWWLKNLQFNLNRYLPLEGEGYLPVLFVQNKCALGEDYKMQDVSIESGNDDFYLPVNWRYHHLDLKAADLEQTNGEEGIWTIRFKLFKAELLKALESQLESYKFAVYQRDIRDQLLKLNSVEKRVNEMPWADFEALCRAIEPDAKMDVVIVYLRDVTGDILYFEKNNRLKDRVFLHPEWVCDRIYTILSRNVLENNGIFDLEWVKTALQCKEQEALDFVALMHEFQLIFTEYNENNEPSGNYVAPQYLPTECPYPETLKASKIHGRFVHGFTIWYPDFLPPSHIARFVARWGDKAQNRVFWKKGLLFTTDGCSVLVELLNDENKIRVEINVSNSVETDAILLRIFNSFQDNEEGFAEFAISRSGKDFVKWNILKKAIADDAQQVETYPIKKSKFINIWEFKIFFPENKGKKNLFISYSESDKNYLEAAKKHLKIFERQNKLSIWDDTQLVPGVKWDDAIKCKLAAADIILFLVSSDLIATDYVWNFEMQTALARAEAGEAAVVPVIVRACAWESAPFGKFNALPAKGKPVSSFENEDEAWREVVKKIEMLLTS